MKNISIVIFFLLNVLQQGKGQQIHCSYPISLTNFNTELGSTINEFDWTDEWYSNFYINFNGGVLNITFQIECDLYYEGLYHNNEFYGRLEDGEFKTKLVLEN